MLRRCWLAFAVLVSVAAPVAAQSTSSTIDPKSVVLDVEGPSPPLTERGMVRVGATANTKVNREEFGLMYNRLIEAGGVVVGDEVNITIDLEMTRPAATE